MERREAFWRGSGTCDLDYQIHEQSLSAQLTAVKFCTGIFWFTAAKWELKCNYDQWLSSSCSSPCCLHRGTGLVEVKGGLISRKTAKWGKRFDRGNCKRWWNLLFWKLENGQNCLCWVPPEGRTVSSLISHGLSQGTGCQQSHFLYVSPPDTHVRTHARTVRGYLPILLERRVNRKLEGSQASWRFCPRWELSVKDKGSNRRLSNPVYKRFSFNKISG